MRVEFQEVVWIGPDEINRRKGYNYLTVFANLLAKRVIFATANKDATVWDAFALELLRHTGQPNAMQYVATEISVEYIKGASDNLGNAQTMYDNCIRAVNPMVPTPV
jgi:transposase